MTVENDTRNLILFLSGRYARRTVKRRRAMAARMRHASPVQRRNVDVRAELPSLAQLVAEGHRVAVLTRHQEARHAAERWAS